MSVRNTVKSTQDIMRKDVGVDGDAQRLSQLCWMFFLKIIDDQDKELEKVQKGYHSPIPRALRYGKELLTRLDEAEKQTTTLRDQPKAILEEALLR